jgi:basic membrane protein A and related proteins
MKRIVLILVVLAVVLCGQSLFAAPKTFPVGMVTDAGTIDDKSFNQGTWEGVLQAGSEFKFKTKYLKPSGTTEADYVKEIGNLYDAGFKFIVCPGFKFETAIFITQDKYTDAKFVLIDGSPNNGKYDATRKEKVGPNTVAIFFAEHESGFIAGVAAALQLKEGEIGFIGGMEIPAVQKFNWGFQQGVAYANKTFGTKIVQTAENVVYQGTFSDVAAGQQLAASMFDKGVKAIFAAAGGVGVGAINEAKTRVVAGKSAWIIGVDVDQYADGEYDTTAHKSIILTSAMKGIRVASYNMIKAEREGTFPGGQTLHLGVKENAVGIPEKNPNLSADVQKKVAKVVADMKAGKIKVAAEKGSLIK